MGHCMGCGGADLFDDIASGDAVCTACGWVVADDRIYDSQSSTRTRPRRAIRKRQNDFIRAESLLCRAARAVAADFGIDSSLLLIEATRTGTPEDARGPVDVALCRAVARLCGGDSERAQGDSI